MTTATQSLLKNLRQKKFARPSHSIFKAFPKHSQPCLNTTISSTMNFSSLVSRSEDPNPDQNPTSLLTKNTGGNGKDGNVSHLRNNTCNATNSDASAISNAHKHLRTAKTREKAWKAEPILMEIWEEVEKHMYESRKTWCDGDEQMEGLSQEELLVEVKGILATLTTRNPNRSNLTLATSAQQSTISSLRRQVGEERGRALVLERVQKELKVQRRKLEDALVLERSAVEMERCKIERLQEEKDDLHQRNEHTRHLLSEMEKECMIVKTDCVRLSEVVGSLRGDVVSARHATGTARLKAKHVRDERKGLEERIDRERTGSAAVTNRIKELQAMQDEVNEAVQVARTRLEDRRTAPRGLAAPREQRGEAVNGIGSVFRRRRNRDVERRIDDNRMMYFGRRRERVEWSLPSVRRTVGRKDVRDKRRDVRVMKTRVEDDEVGTEWDSEDEYEEIGGILNPVNGLRKIGSGLQRKLHQRKTMRRHAETVHRIVNEDVDALRTIIEKKSGEVEELEDMLEESRRRVHMLEDAFAEEKRKTRMNDGVRNAEHCVIRNGMRAGVEWGSVFSTRVGDEVEWWRKEVVDERMILF